MKTERLGLAAAAAMVGAYGLAVLAPVWLFWPSVYIYCGNWCWPF